MQTRAGDPAELAPAGLPSIFGFLYILRFIVYFISGLSTLGLGALAGGRARACVSTALLSLEVERGAPGRARGGEMPLLERRGFARLCSIRGAPSVCLSICTPSTLYRADARECACGRRRRAAPAAAWLASASPSLRLAAPCASTWMLEARRKVRQRVLALGSA